MEAQISIHQFSSFYNYEIDYHKIYHFPDYRKLQHDD